MSVTTFTNNWKNIIDKLRNILRTEFKGTIPVYIGEAGQEGSQFIRLDPLGSELLEYNTTSESREFTIIVYYYFIKVFLLSIRFCFLSIILKLLSSIR